MRRSYTGVFAALVLALAPLTACAAVTSADFDVVARPTECSMVAPQAADPKVFLRCDAASTCIATAEGRTACYPVAVSGAEGDACSAENDCAPGLTCSPQRGCLRACEVGTPCADGTACNQFSSGAVRSATGYEYGYCSSPSCDPLHARHPQGEGLVACTTDDCYFVAASRTSCFPSGGFTRASEGATCIDDRRCAVGDSCYEGTCHRLCRVGGNECAFGRTCVPGASDVGDASLLGERYGHCE